MGIPLLSRPLPHERAQSQINHNEITISRSRHQEDPDKTAVAPCYLGTRTSYTEISRYYKRSENATLYFENSFFNGPYMPATFNYLSAMPANNNNNACGTGHACHFQNPVIAAVVKNVFDRQSRDTRISKFSELNFPNGRHFRLHAFC